MYQQICHWFCSKIIFLNNFKTDPESCYEAGPNSFSYKCNSTHYIQNICNKKCLQCKPFLQTPHGCQTVGENSIYRRCGKIGNVKEKGYVWKHYYGSECEGAKFTKISTLQMDQPNLFMTKRRELQI
jgi:hypothetical protein